ncbi:hypothetical protein MMC13_003180 [Lambiella insularis]|nr:hypothetical protein [Lambiella insularis]
MIALCCCFLWVASLFIATGEASAIHTLLPRFPVEYGAQLESSNYQPLYPSTDDLEPSWLGLEHHVSLDVEKLIRNLTLDSRSLKTRASPEELPIEYGDIPGVSYDSTCDNGRRVVVNAAFKSGILLSTTARDAMMTIISGIKSKTSVTQRRKWVGLNNFAYTQMFGADDNPDHAQAVADVFQTILDKIQTQTADGRNNKRLHIMCRETFMTKPTVQGGKADDQCASTSSSKAAFAFTVGLDQAIDPDIVAMYPRPDPAEFIDAKAALASKDKSKLSQICNLNQMQNTAQIMIHEWTHLPWIKNTNSNTNIKEVYGFVATSKKATLSSGKPDFAFASLNAESYAWFAVYNHWNSLDVATGITYKDPRARFVQTMLSYPGYRWYVRSLAWTFLVLDEWDQDPIPIPPPLTELWPVLQGLPNVLSVDVAHIDCYWDLCLLGPPPKILFPSATSVRLVGRLDYTFATSILHAIDPACLVSLCLDNVQDEGQMSSENRSVPDLYISTAEQVDTYEPDGQRGWVVEGGMRKLLAPLAGRCTALRELVLRKAGQEKTPTEFWNNKADEELYEEWAMFVESTKRTLRTVVLEQGLPTWGVGQHEPRSRHLTIRGPLPPRQLSRPMDERFMRILFPVLTTGHWPCLERMEIRGVGSWDGVQAMDEGKQAELRRTIGDGATLVVEEAASTSFEHIGNFVYMWPGWYHRGSRVEI